MTAPTCTTRGCTDIALTEVRVPRFRGAEYIGDRVDLLCYEHRPHVRDLTPQIADTTAKEAP